MSGCRCPSCSNTFVCPRSGEYQSFSDWTYVALSEGLTRKIKADAPLPSEVNLPSALWTEAGSTFIAAIVTSPQMDSIYAWHADKLLEHLAYVIRSFNAGFIWTRLLDYDRAVR